LRDLTTKLKVTGDTAATNPPARRSLLTTQLKGADQRWSRLELSLFLRGFGDVEHIVLVGVDAVHLKVAALYIN
jgi:hypothetical protein